MVSGGLSAPGVSPGNKSAPASQQKLASRPKRERRLRLYSECGLGEGKEGLRVPQQVIGFTGGRGPRQTGLCRGSLAGPGSEISGPFRESGFHLRQQFPHTVRLPAP